MTATATTFIIGKKLPFRSGIVTLVTGVFCYLHMAVAGDSPARRAALARAAHRAHYLHLFRLTASVRGFRSTRRLAFWMFVGMPLSCCLCLVA
jgi:hypothetical protein